MREIESRISELLAERGVTGEKVISSEDVVAIKEQLGEIKILPVRTRNMTYRVLKA